VATKMEVARRWAARAEGTDRKWGVAGVATKMEVTRRWAARAEGTDRKWGVAGVATKMLGRCCQPAMGRVRARLMNAVSQESPKARCKGMLPKASLLALCLV
ncbi:MAG: hypothetical protein ACYDC9_05555, partial [Dermatophilaceae bacterium]